MRTWYYIVLLSFIQTVVPYVYYRELFFRGHHCTSEVVAEIFFKWILDVVNCKALFPICFQIAWICVVIAPEVYEEVKHTKSEENKTVLPL